MGKNIHRKDFLKKLSMGGVLIFGGGTLLSACGDNKEQQQEQLLKNSNEPCNDVSGLTDDELNTRTTNEYVSSSPYNDKFCGTCNLFIMPKEGKECGACQVVKGPISPRGYCKLWIKKVDNQNSEGHS